MNKKITMFCKEKSFRKLEDPFDDGTSIKYIFYVKVDDVAEGIPMSTNPREQKLTSNVAKAIEDSLKSNDGYFHLKNRGIVLSAGSVNYNNRSNEVTITFTDDLAHGNIDGGHTYRIVCEHKGENLNQYVQFEVMVGVEDIIEQLAEARNTSVQVDVKSMSELANKFDPIKEGLEGMPFFKRIAFKQNQVYVDPETNKNSKMIDAREVVAIIEMFDVRRYSESSHPLQAYSSKAKMLEYYLDDPEYFRKFVNIMPDIFDLYEAVEQDFADAYNSNGGKYGRKKYSGYKNDEVIGKTKFGQKDIRYRIPDGILYPIVAAFRTLVVYNEETEKYEWKNNKNPISIWNEVKVNLSYKIMGLSMSIGGHRSLPPPGHPGSTRRSGHASP